MSHHTHPPLSRTRRIAAKLPILALVLALPACSDGSGLLVSPESGQAKERVTEGVRLAGTLSSQLVVMPAGAAPARAEIAPERFAASVRGGAAVPEFARAPGFPAGRPSHADLGGLRVAVEDEGGVTREKRVVARDEAGRTHEIVLESVGKRLIGSRHYIDGVLFASVDQSWGRERAFWILKGLTATAAWEGSSGSLRTSVNSNPVWAASIGEAIEGIPAAPAGPSLYLMPEGGSCLSATLDLLASSGALAIALAGGQVWMVGVGFFAYSSAVLDYWAACY
jgi:hypothetical protein